MSHSGLLWSISSKLDRWHYPNICIHPDTILRSYNCSYVLRVLCWGSKETFLHDDWKEKLSSFSFQLSLELLSASKWRCAHVCTQYYDNITWWGGKVFIKTSVFPLLDILSYLGTFCPYTLISTVLYHTNTSFTNQHLPILIFHNLEVYMENGIGSIERWERCGMKLELQLRKLIVVLQKG